MAFPSVTYSFLNGATADATQVNQNFTDLINGISDTTKDVSVNNITAAGTATLNGNVVVGISSSKTLIVNAVLSSSIVIGTNSLYDFGGSTLGLASVYLGSAGALTTRVVGGATGASWTLTLPTSTGTNLQVLQTNGSGVSTWATPPQEISTKRNYSLVTTVGANAMTVTLNYQDGTALSATQVATFYFRSATAATGQNVLRNVTSSVSTTISSGATLGLASGQPEFIYIYAIDNAGTVELAFSGAKNWDEGSVVSTTGVSGASTSRTTLYSTTSRVGVALRYIGRIISNQTVAGTYTALATEASLIPPNIHLPVFVWAKLVANYTTAANAPIKFDTDVTDTDSAYATGTGLFTTPSGKSGLYAIKCVIQNTSGNTPSIIIYKNGTSFAYLFTLNTDTQVKSGSMDIFLNSGDTIGIYSDSPSTFAGNAPPTSHVSISKLW